MNHYFSAALPTNVVTGYLRTESRYEIVLQGLFSSNDPFLIQT
jgi:hypothetical protein